MTRRPLSILFVTPYTPVSNRLRPHGFLRELGKKHRVTVVCLAQPAWEAERLNEVTELCEAVHPVYPNRFKAVAQGLAALPSRTPLSVAYCRSAGMERTIRRLLEEQRFDLVHTEFIRAAPYTARLQGIPKVFDAVDSLALAYHRAAASPHSSWRQRALAWEEWLKLRSYEPAMLRNFDRAIVSSPVDRGHLVSPGAPQVDVIPNGLDLDYFTHNAGERDPDGLVFLGKMSYYVNVDSVLYFTRRILPLIRAARPGVHFSVVGYNPPPVIQALAKDAHIEVTGSVEDVRPYLARAAVCVCPMVSGSGIQNKILQSMAVGTPVVTTSLASAALGAIPGQHLLVADTPQDFAQSVLCLLNDPDLAREIGCAARQYVEEHHDWGKIGDRLDALYQDIV